MTANDKPSGHRPPPRRSAQLRGIGIIVLALGLGGAGIVYGTRAPDLSGDPSMLGFNRPAERQMRLLYGKMGTLIEDWSDDLQQAGTQAVLIAGFSVLVAGGCFYFARLLESDGETDQKPEP